MPADPRDLTILDDVKAWSEIKATDTASDGMIQDVITAASIYFLTRTGRDSLNSVATYNEWYDGRGGMRMFVRNYPITQVTALQINGVTIAASSGWGSSGYVIDQNGRSLSLRQGLSGQPISYGFSYCFTRGLQNINLQYKAGYAATPADVKIAVEKMIAESYKRRGWVGLKTQVMSQVGTTVYTSWEVAPEVEAVIQQYKRMALV